jgi:hypothetical protein
MKTLVYCVTLATVGLLISCGGGRTGLSGEGLVTIDISSDYPYEEIHLQEIADVEYIPLAISKEVLLTPTDQIFYLSDRYIMVANRGRGDIFLFDRTGAIVSRINRLGRAPNEYMTISHIVFDEQAGEIFVNDLFPPRKIQVFSSAGEHRRTITLPEGWRIATWNLDSEALLTYNNWHQDGGGPLDTTPYYLISKNDGAILDTLPIVLPVRYSTSTVQSVPGQGPNGQTSYRVWDFRVWNHRLGGRNITLADISSDTIYHYSPERVLTPALVRTPSVHASEPRTVWGMELVTESFVVFSTVTLDFESAFAGNGYSIGRLMYDYATGRVVKPSFIDDNWPSGSWMVENYDTEAPVDTAVSMLDPLRIVEAHEKGELSGPLAEIAAGLKEDDNPVVMVVKFKK